ncbi:helix-turn-helix protein [Lacibacter cauensis]|uniref:Helix-turn-helix protein n=1 Tax=Lacibacter cauensis TaxID=510947 RepID=A0A562SI23_9BACT|nr:helix-turn-helix protein [Lacibacter cauensis]
MVNVGFLFQKSIQAFNLKLDREKIVLFQKQHLLHQKFHIPHPALQDFVSNIMIVEADLNHIKQSVICPFPPTPQNCIYFYINDPVQTQKLGTAAFTKKAPSIIVGPQLTRVNLEMGKNHLMLCVSFHPGGLFRLLGIPMKHFFDEDVDAALLFSDAEISSINQQLKEANSWQHMKNIVELFLISKIDKLKTLLPFDMAMKELVKSGGTMSMESTASLSCLSLRQFERTCNERIGLSPKLFARLVRFSKAYRLKESQQQLSWTSIAYSSGYFDQMHLIRDFKEFAGVTPRFLEDELTATPLRLQANIKI